VCAHPPSVYERNSLDEKAVRKVKINKFKMKFSLIEMYKILTGSLLPEKTPSIFSTYVRIQ
jgi:hypothetical protein